MDEPWTGRWITCDSSQNGHPIFSKKIQIGKRSEKRKVIAMHFAAWDCMRHIAYKGK